jgi:hypothetical protein
MNKIALGILGGLAAGVVDIIPMIWQHLPWDATLSAFAFWVVCGFLISVVELEVYPALKGIFIAALVLIPVGILVAAKEPASLIPMSCMTILLGGSLGFVIFKFSKREDLKTMAD